jgi:hypothetical protein
LSDCLLCEKERDDDESVTSDASTTAIDGYDASMSSKDEFYPAVKIGRSHLCAYCPCSFYTVSYYTRIMSSTDSSAQLSFGTSLTSLANQPSTLRYAPGIHLTPLQQYHVCLVFDLFQAKGTWAKIEEGLTKDAVYEDLFATAKNRVEVGE